MADVVPRSVRSTLMSSADASMPRPHPRPADGEVSEILGHGRVLWFMRVAGFLVVATMAPLYTLVHPAIVAAALAIVGTTILLQPQMMRDDLAPSVVRTRALLGLLGDLVAVYLVGTAFAADPDWLGFYFYPLIALEATLVAGSWAGVAVTVTSVGVYLAQLALHQQYGNVVDVRAVMGALAMLALTGGTLAAFGGIAERGRRDLRVLLDLTSALAHQRDQTETIELLDRRLASAVGARVRSVAVRRDDGSYEVLRWHTTENRTLPRAALERVLGDVHALEGQFAAGQSVTYPVEPGAALAIGLGLPEFTRSVTLIPVFVEDAWVGILPVLWPGRHVPSRHQLRLLYGLSGQVGMALAQGQLQRVREEAATDPLTGLANRRTIMAEVAAEIARTERRGGTLSVLFCDLDAFKAINDRDGHAAGDRVLRTVAASLRAIIRQGDTAGRYGGDELLVLAPDTNAAGGERLARRIGAAVRLAAGDDGVNVTIGVASWPADGRTALELVAAADEAMYRGKQRGRGSVIVPTSATEPLPTSA